MPSWSPNRPPNQYPAVWQAVLKEARPGLYKIGWVADKEAVRKFQKRFASFRASCANYPGSECGRVLADFKALVKCRDNTGVWHCGGFDLYIELRPRHTASQPKEK